MTHLPILRNAPTLVSPIKGTGAMPLVETDPVKLTDVREAELALEASGLCYTILRPQYIYGPRASKRYLDHFLGRAYRQLHIALPVRLARGLGIGVDV